jgi:serine/threonine protein kinase
MNTELERVNESLQKCSSPEQLFGKLAGTKEEQLQAARVIYLKLAKVVHSDLYLLKSDKELAHQAFTKLNALWSLCQSRVHDGHYGTSIPTLQKSKTPVVMKSANHTYIVESGLAGGDMSNVYIGTNGTRQVLLKVSRSYTLNSFMENEYTRLSSLADKLEKTVSLKRYFPAIIETFMVKDGKTREVRWVNVFEYEPGYHPLPTVSLEYPEGVDQRHFAWMWNRIMTVLSAIHSEKIFHTSILPANVLINPDTHGMMITGWGFAVSSGSKPLALSKSYLDWYAPEIKQKLPVTPSTDIFMAAQCMIYVLGGNPITPLSAKVDIRFRRLLDSCIIKSQARRSSDAWQLYEAGRKLQDEVFGKRQFVKLQLSSV